MRAAILTVAGAALTSAQVSSSPTPSPTAADTSEPCAVVSAVQSASPSAFLNPEIALACLESVPVDQDGDSQLTDELKLYLEWQTTLSYLEAPPQGYDNPPTELLKGMDAIKQKITDGAYKSEYEVQMAVSKLLTSAHDGHLAFGSDILSVFSFETKSPLVAASVDGIQLPKIYLYADLVYAMRYPNVTFTPSPVTQINGQNIQDYLTLLAEQSILHDADSRYNDLFYSLPKSSVKGGAFGLTTIGDYAGPWTNLTFENGTNSSFQNIAVTKLDFTGVDDGNSFFSTFCTGPPTESTQEPSDVPTPSPTDTPVESSTVPTPTVRPTAFGFPYPVIKHSENSVGGYFLNGTDVAVLSIPTFEAGESVGAVQEFQDVVTTFIQESVKQTKGKLIIDLRGNGGGNTILGFDTFKQLFPSIEPWGASRFRAHESFYQIGKLLEPFISNATLAESDPEIYRYLQTNFTNFNYVATLTENNADFASWDQYYGPHEFNSDNFTSVTRYNFSNPASTSYFGFNVTGYDNRTNVFTSQPFATENIVMLQDGNCASTCAIITELLKEQGGVKTIAMGGRPRNGPMQGVGGTKGALTLYGGAINRDASLALSNLTASDDQYNELLGSSIGKLANATLPQLRSYAGGDVPGNGLQINAVDNIRDTDVQGQTPLEFVYEAADCRIFYTLHSVVNVTAAWAEAANAMWGNGTCVPDSKSPPSSVSGGGAHNNGADHPSPSPSPPPQGAAGVVRPGSAIMAAVLAAAITVVF